MTATASSKTTKTETSRVDELLKVHRELTALYPTQVGARKAQTSRKINLAQIELDLIGAEYDFWVKPQPVTVTRFIFTESELVERIQGLRAAMAREDRPESYRAQVDKELSARLEESVKRGIVVPDAE